MSAERFRQVEALFQQARSRPASERSEFLRSVCDDPDLRREVMNLLDANEDASFLATPPDPPPPRRAGPLTIAGYRVRSVLGEGGMGIVYLADQERTERTVALKVIRPGFATAALVRRFELEALALGRLNHPAIAQVYEAGVHEDDAGRTPFIAMEYVQGSSLRQYLNEIDPDLETCLQILITISQAVDHAHEQGVIHRDLKPANIIVTDGSTGELPDQPKVLDFGIARIVESETPSATLQTNTGQLLGTVQYMSPEQAGGDPLRVDARTDVYSLGAIAYETIVGRPAHDLSGKVLHDAVRVICEEDPAPPSTISKRLRGDLETILLTALEKERDRRYPTVRAFVDDLRRFQRDEPIMARPPSRVYRVGKFVRRNRGPVLGASLVFTALAIGLVISLVFAIATDRARADEAAARAKAEERLNDVRDLARSFIFDFDQRIRFVSGTLPARRLVVERGLQYLDRVAAEAGDDDELALELAVAYDRLAEIQESIADPELGGEAAASESLAKAISLLEPIDRFEEAYPRVVLIRTQAHRARLLVNQRQTEEMLTLFEDAEALARATVDRYGHPDAYLALTDVMSTRGRCLRSLGRNDEARAALEYSRDTILELITQLPDEKQLRHALAVDTFQLALFESGAARLDLLTEYIAILDPLLESDPDNPVYRRDLVVGCERLAEVTVALDRPGEAQSWLVRGLGIVEQHLEDSPDDLSMIANGAVVCIRLVDLAVARDDRDAALRHVAVAEDLARRRADVDVDLGRALREVGVVLYKQGEIHRMRAADPSEAAPGRIEAWHEAERLFTACRDHFVDMRTRELLSAADDGVVDAIQADIDGCVTARLELE